MKSLSFRKDLVGVQDELLRFAYKLTTDREEAKRSNSSCTPTKSFLKLTLFIYVAF